MVRVVGPVGSLQKGGSQLPQGRCVFVSRREPTRGNRGNIVGSVLDDLNPLSGLLAMNASACAAPFSRSAAAQDAAPPGMGLRYAWEGMAVRRPT